VTTPFIARRPCSSSPCPGTGGGACSRADWNEGGVIDFNDFLDYYNAWC